MAPVTTPMASAAETEVERLARWVKLSTETLAKLDEVISLSAGPNERIAQLCLDALASRARVLKRELMEDIRCPSVTAGYGSLGEWGPNGMGPQVDDLLASARYHSAKSDDALSLRRAA